EDGIRDLIVTGVQTCALPISMGAVMQMLVGGKVVAYTVGFGLLCVVLEIFLNYRQYAAVLKFTTLSLFTYVAVVLTVHLPLGQRSEERRVGKEARSRRKRCSV